jgi:hypothetical protein
LTKDDFDGDAPDVEMKGMESTSPASHIDEERVKGSKKKPGAQ